MRKLVALAGIAVLVVACGGSSTPSASPSSSVPAVESSSPIARPTAAPSGKTYSIRLPADGGKRVRVAVRDPGAVLSGVRMPTASEAADVENTPMSGNAGITEGRNRKTLVVTWVGSVCDRRVNITVRGATVTVAPVPTGPCDSMALARSVTLKFKSAVDPDGLIVGYVPPSGAN